MDLVLKLDTQLRQCIALGRATGVKGKLICVSGKGTHTHARRARNCIVDDFITLALVYTKLELDQYSVQGHLIPVQILLTAFIPQQFNFLSRDL